MTQKDIWYTRCPVPTALGVAVRRGRLIERLAGQDYALRSLQASADRATRLSHFTHTQDRSIRHGGNIPAIHARAHGAETRVVALSWTDTPHPVLALPHSGIRTAADLKGRRLALPRRLNDPVDFWRASALRTYEVALASAGLTLDDIELVDLPVERSYLDNPAPAVDAVVNRLAAGADLQRTEVFALLRGEVDAIYSQGSFTTEVTSFIGTQVVYDANTHADPLERANNALPEVFTVSASLIAEDFEAVAILLAESILAADWARDNRAEALRIVASEQRLSEEVVDVAYGPALTGQLGIDLSDARRAALARRKQDLLRHGFIDTDFDVDAWIDPRPLARARELVAIWTADGGDVARPQERAVA